MISASQSWVRIKGGDREWCHSTWSREATPLVKPTWPAHRVPSSQEALHELQTLTVSGLPLTWRHHVGGWGLYMVPAFHRKQGRDGRKKWNLTGNKMPGCRLGTISGRTVHAHMMRDPKMREPISSTLVPHRLAAEWTPAGHRGPQPRWIPAV